MNIFFINPEYFPDEIWKDVVTALKVGTIYSFIPFNELREAFHYTPNPVFQAVHDESSYKRFANDIVYQMANRCKQYIKQIERYVDNESYTDSIWNNPYKNIVETDDDNVIILGEIHYRNDFETVFVEDLEFEDKDVKLYIASYLLNILKKQFGHDEYRKRICFASFNLLGYNYELFKGNEFINARFGRKRRMPFQVMLYLLLQKVFPDRYPLEEVDGKIKCVKYLESERLISVNKKWEEHKWERREREREESNFGFGESLQDQIDEMNREFWDSLGESSVNLM